MKGLLLWELVSGGGHFGGGLFINSEDQARFGLLFLRDGMRKGNRLISSDSIKRPTKPSKKNPIKILNNIKDCSIVFVIFRYLMLCLSLIHIS